MISKSKEHESWLYRTIKKSGYGLVATSLAFNYGCSHNASQDTKTTDECGVIGKTLKDSKPFEPEKEKSIPGAPNVVWIVLDDVGFGATSAFGGLIETPKIGRASCRERV